MARRSSSASPPEVRGHHGDPQQLFLKQRNAQGALEDGLQTGMRILHRYLALPPVEEGLDHSAHDGAGPDDGHLNHDVVERRRRIARQRRHLRAAFHLEHADGVCLVEHFVDQRIGLRQMRQIDVDALALEDHGEGLFDRLQHAETEQIDFDDAEIRAVVFVPLNDHAPRHRRRLQRHDLIEPSSGHDHPPGVLPEVAGKILDLHLETHEVLHPQILEIEANRGERLAAGRVGQWHVGGSHHHIADLAEGPGADAFRQLVGLLQREAERLAHFPRSRAVAVGDDVRRHRRTMHSVRLVHVLDHFLPLGSRRKIEIDVGPFAALFGEEALEQQLHLHRVDRGDREGIADRAVRRRPSALHQDLLPLAELHDVPDDEEVPRQIELLDHGQLLFDLRLCFRRERSEARCGAVPGDLAQERHR